MRSLHRRIRGLTLLGLSAGMVVLPAAPPAHATEGCTWSLSRVGRAGSTFIDVDAVSSREGWAVGFRDAYPDQQPLVGHWDGSEWTVVPTPPVRGLSTLAAVDALGPRDAWAVGDQDVGGSHQLYMHWNGTRWHVVAGPIRDRGVVSDVVALAHDDVWAVGWAFDGVSAATRVWHWDGSAWSRAELPAIRGFLSQIDGVSGRLIVTGVELGPTLNDVSAILLKGPRTWRRLPIDGSAVVEGSLGGVSRRWAIGRHVDGGPSVPWAIRRSPTGWTTVPVTGVDQATSLGSITETPGGEAWAFGEREVFEDPLSFVSEIMHWNGSSWSRDPGPIGYDEVPSRILGSTAVPGTGTLLAVGDVYVNGSSGRGMILQRC